MAVSTTSRIRSFEELWELRAVLQEEGPGVGLPLRLLEGLRALLRCDAVAFNELDSGQQLHHFFQVADHEGSGEVLSPPPEDEAEQVFWSLYWQSDCSLPDRTGDLSGVRLLSDTYSRRQWHEQPLYHECPSAASEFEMSTVWSGGSPGRTLRLLCVRDDGPDFDDHDRFLLELLRPHVYAAFQRAEALRDQQAGTGVAALTARQRQVLALVTQGLTNRAIGRSLGISEDTVRTHLMNTYPVLGVSSRAAAAALLTASPPDLVAPGPVDPAALSR